MPEDNVVKERVRPVVNTGPGLTKQSHKDETNVNLILRRYQKTGMINFVNSQKGAYMDTDPIEFQDAMNMIIQANNMFESIPSGIRKRFSNDPKEFYEFLHNPENEEEMIRLGLATAKIPAPVPEPEPEPAPEPTPAQ